MDIKLYKSNGNFVTPLDTEFDSEQMDDSVLSDTPSSDIETIAGRVVKFLLTNIGTDLFDSEYGGYIPSYTQISQNDLPRIRLEIADDIDRCLTYITDSDRNDNATGELLQSLSLKKVVYDFSTRNRLDIYIEIKTNLGNYALLAMPITT